MRLAIMQPYFFPYIGYFQLINAVDKFVFYDDVNYINRGWINRNSIIINGERKYITIPLHKASQNKKINEIYIKGQSSKILKMIKFNYSKAPFFKEVYKLVKKVILKAKYPELISTIAGDSIKEVCNYLNLNKTLEYSSELYFNTQGMYKAERLIEICKRNDVKEYINAANGKELYNKKYFKNREINLRFIKNNVQSYKQFNKEFIPYLSIIDVMMFNSPEVIREMLNDYFLM